MAIEQIMAQMGQDVKDLVTVRFKLVSILLDKGLWILKPGDETKEAQEKVNTWAMFILTGEIKG